MPDEQLCRGPGSAAQQGHQGYTTNAGYVSEKYAVFGRVRVDTLWVLV
jgi:hypothetical protein